MGTLNSYSSCSERTKQEDVYLKQKRLWLGIRRLDCLKTQTAQGKLHS